MSKSSGVLEVGTNGSGEVVINHPDLEPDENGVGHIVFSVEQARDLANLLLMKSADAQFHAQPREFRRHQDHLHKSFTTHVVRGRVSGYGQRLTR